MPERRPNTPGLFEKYTTEQKLKLYNLLSEFYSENKRDLFDRLVQQRTRHITVMIEDIYQSHNASAVLRSCDCFGVQDVHVVENHNQFNPAGDVAVGSSKWIDYYKYRTTQEAYENLRKKGYRIIATLPHENDTLIGNLDLTQPTALVFGTELTGLTQEAIEMADGYVKIPMYGFTESFNISVSVALSLFSTTERIRNNADIQWQLSEDEQIEQKLYWSLQVIRDGDKVLENILGNTDL